MAQSGTQAGALGAQVGPDASNPVADIPQSDTDTIARRLLGDDLVNQFGDVIGARPAGLKDALRDFAIGAAQGPAKVAEVRLQARKAFEDSLIKQQRAAIARQSEERKKATASLSALKNVQGLPAGHRVGILKNTLAQLGIEGDPAVLKMLADGDLLAQLPFNDLFEAAQRGDVSIAQIQEVFSNPQAATSFITGMIRAQKDQQQTGNLIIDANKKRIGLANARQDLAERTTGIPQNLDPDIAGNERVAAERELRARASGVANKDQPSIEGFKGFSDNKLRALVQGRKKGGSGSKKKASNPVDAAMDRILEGFTLGETAPAQAPLSAGGGSGDVTIERVE